MVRYFILFFVLIVLNLQGLAQDSARAVPFTFFTKGRINGYIFYQCGRATDFKRNVVNGEIDYAQPTIKFRSSVGINIGVHLFEYVYFRSTWFYHLNRNIVAPWINTDYSYTLERTKWVPNSFSYGYINYQVNKYKASKNDVFNSLLRGSYYVRYFNQFPRSWLRAMGMKETLNLTYYVSLYYAMKYLDNQNVLKGDVFNGKPMVSFNARYTFFKNIYLEGSVNYFPNIRNKVNADADFTYGFGYNKYAKMTFGFSYGNYAVNKFPWNKKVIKGYGFLDGNFILLWNYQF